MVARQRAIKAGQRLAARLVAMALAPRGAARGVALLIAGLAWLGPLAGGASATNLLYYGGPVVHSVNIVQVQWGSDVRPSYANPTTGDQGLFKYLVSQNGSTSDI